jgi:hypothetical protein
MKRKIIAIAASLLVAGIASSQPMPPPAPGGAWDGGAFWRGAPDNPRERIDFLQDRINRGVADGSLNRHEARHANDQLNGVRQWIHRMHWEDGGRLTPDQRAQVQQRLDSISRQIRWARHNGW